MFTLVNSDGTQFTLTSEMVERLTKAYATTRRSNETDVIYLRDRNAYILCPHGWQTQYPSIAR